MIDRTPNPFGKSRTEPNRRFGRTEPSAKLGFPQKVRPLGRTGSASRPNLCGLPGGTQVKGKEYRIVMGYGRSLLFAAHSPGYSGFPSGTTAGRRMGGGPADLPPSPILPRLPSSLSPCLDSRPYRPREKTPLSEVCSPFGRSRPRPSCRVGGSWPTDSTLVREFTYTD